MREEACQEKVCKEYAVKNGYDIVNTFIEQGESAKNANRTQLKLMLEYCAVKKNGISVVIAYKIDRVARNIDDYRQIRLLLKRYDVDIKSTSEYFEDTPAGRFMENIIANVAQFDNDVRTERSVNGSRDAMREGRYVWNAPFGYSNGKVAGRSTIVPNELAPVILKAFEEVARNQYSVDVIRRQMASEGLTTKCGATLTRSHFYKLLNCEVYTGWIIKFGERHKGSYETIIPEDLFEQVQRVLHKRSHSTFIYQHENPDFPLRRFVRHPDGTKITGSWCKGRKKKYAYYRFVGISNTDIRKEQLEDLYIALLDRYKIDSKHIAYLKTALKVALDAATEKDTKQAEQLQSHIAELNARQSSLIEKNEKGIISDSILRRQLEQIEDKLTQAHAMIYALPQRKADVGKLMDFVSDYLQHPGSAWTKASFKRKIQLQWFEFPQGVTFQDGNFRTKEIVSIFKVKDLFLTDLSSSVPSGGQSYEQTGNNKAPPIPLETLKQYADDLQVLADILTDKPPLVSTNGYLSSL